MADALIWGILMTAFPLMIVMGKLELAKVCEHDDVIKWKHFQRYWPFVAGHLPNMVVIVRYKYIMGNLCFNNSEKNQEDKRNEGNWLSNLTSGQYIVSSRYDILPGRKGLYSHHHMTSHGPHEISNRRRFDCSFKIQFRLLTTKTQKTLITCPLLCEYSAKQWIRKLKVPLIQDQQCGNLSHVMTSPCEVGFPHGPTDVR